MAMNCFSISFMVVLTAGAILNTAPISAEELFHSGSTGNCDGCHATRGSDSAGSGQTTTEPAAGDPMLLGSDPSSTCLRCHEAPAGVMQPQGYYVSTSEVSLRGTAPGQLSPAGDFGWLKKNYRWQDDGKQARSDGERHGHNIVARDYNYTADATLRTAPGGAYPADALSCISCHDPHGTYRRSAAGTISTTGLPIIGSGSYDNSPNPDAGGTVGTYRMLAGKGYQPKSAPAAAPFTADPPAAVTPGSYNRTEARSDTRVAYGSGMSEWCQNCHGQIHSDGGPRPTQHPTGNNATFSMRVVQIYNYYIKSGDLNGSGSSSYTSMVPYEEGTADYSALKAIASNNGSNLNGPGAAGTNPNVMCLSCHRAHASGWDSMMRWNGKSTYLVHNGRYPGIDNGAPEIFAQGRTEAEVQKAFYDRPVSRYAYYQRSLCNKCHAED